MITTFLILFLSAFLSGILVFLIPQVKKKNFKIILAFSGSYLFSTTIVHIIPELFADSKEPYSLAIGVLFGFFFQLVLEYFTQGVEHGHIHHHHESNNENFNLPFSLIIALFVHALLEGMILYHPSAHHENHESNTLLIGLMVHKCPEAFTLMSILILNRSKLIYSLVILLLVSLASPIGLLLSGWIQLTFVNVVSFIFALVAGNFLYISTTIFFETSPEHKFKPSRLLVSILGAAMAVASQWLFHQ